MTELLMFEGNVKNMTEERRGGVEAEWDRNFTMVNMFRILDHDSCCLY